jgi:hypothetical protein
MLGPLAVAASTLKSAADSGEDCARLYATGLDCARLGSTVHPLGDHWPATGQATGDLLCVYWPLLCCTGLDCEVTVYPLGATAP